MADYSLYTDKTGRFWGSEGAGVLFRATATGRLLVPFRSRYVNEPHTWGVWGGKLDKNETPQQAVKREIQEETGFKGHYELEHVWTYQNGDFRYHNYLATVPEEFDPQLDWETETYRWVTLDEIPKPLHFGLKALLPHLREHLATLKQKVQSRYRIHDIS